MTGPHPPCYSTAMDESLAVAGTGTVTDLALLSDVDRDPSHPYLRALLAVPEVYAAAISTVPDIVRACLATLSHDRDYERVYAKIERIDIAGSVHLLWHGRYRRQVGVVSLWRGHKDVPVHRILWPIYRKDDCAGNPRRVEECGFPTCVNPLCFRVTVPMETAPAPGGRQGKRRWAFPHRAVWHGEATVNPATGLDWPACPNCRAMLPFDFGTDEARRKMGEQVYCAHCYQMNMRALEEHRRQPRGPWRAGLPDDSLDEDVRAFMRDMPVYNPDDDEE